MISTLLTENSPSFPFQSWDLAQGHLVCAEPKPFCQNPVLVPHKQQGGSKPPTQRLCIILKRRGERVLRNVLRFDMLN